MRALEEACPACAGTGEQRCDLHHEHSVYGERCENDGLACPLCDGAKTVSRWMATQFRALSHPEKEATT